MDHPESQIDSANAPRKRVRLFDTLRGFSVVSMVLFHFYYDLVFFIGIVPTTAFFTTAVDIWRASISWTFLFIAGAMVTFSKSNLKRAGLYLAVAAAIYLVTSFIGKDVEISFGIIYCMGACTLIAALLQMAGFKPDGWGWIAAFLIAFLLLLGLHRGSIGCFGIEIARIPRAVYEGGMLSWLGLPGVDFISADYYPLLPYLFLYLTGWQACPAHLRPPPAGPARYLPAHLRSGRALASWPCAPMRGRLRQGRSPRTIRARSGNARGAS